MKKISKPITKKKLKRLKTKDNLFTKDVISLDDSKNKKYLDNFAYQSYLANSQEESNSSNE